MTDHDAEVVPPECAWCEAPALYQTRGVRGFIWLCDQCADEAEHAKRASRADDW